MGGCMECVVAPAALRCKLAATVTLLNLPTDCLHLGEGQVSNPESRTRWACGEKSHPRLAPASGGRLTLWLFSRRVLLHMPERHSAPRPRVASNSGIFPFNFFGVSYSC